MNVSEKHNNLHYILTPAHQLNKLNQRSRTGLLCYSNVQGLQHTRLRRLTDPLHGLSCPTLLVCIPELVVLSADV